MWLIAFDGFELDGWMDRCVKIKGRPRGVLVVFMDFWRRRIRVHGGKDAGSDVILNTR